MSSSLLIDPRSSKPISLENMFNGKSCFLVCSGPSLNTLDLDLLRKSRGIVIAGLNNRWAVVKPHVWTCVDPPDKFLDVGWADPSIMKFACKGHTNRPTRIRLSKDEWKNGPKVKDCPNTWMYTRNSSFNPERWLTEKSVNWGEGKNRTDKIGCKGTLSVMYAAIKLLYYLGIRNLYLVGADFSMKPNQQNYAFKQHRTESCIRHNNRIYKVLNTRLSALKPHFDSAGFNIINCTPNSGLHVFPYMPYEMGIHKASEECNKPIDTDNWYIRTFTKKSGNVRRGRPQKTNFRKYKPTTAPRVKLRQVGGQFMTREL